MSICVLMLCLVGKKMMKECMGFVILIEAMNGNLFSLVLCFSLFHCCINLFVLGCNPNA